MLIRPTKALRIAPGESAEQWFSALADPAWLGAAKILKEDGGSWVRRATILGRDVVVKCRMLNSPRRRIQSWLGLGQGHRQWGGTLRLEQAGIRMCAPLLLVRGEADGSPCEFIVLTFVPGPTVLELLNDIARGNGVSVRTQHRIAEGVGYTIPILLNGGVWNRDHKASNLVVTEHSDHYARVSVIDCVGIRKYATREHDDHEGEAMAASILIEAIGCGCPPRRSLWLRALHAAVYLEGHQDRLKRHADHREIIAIVSRLIAAHGDPTPKINPLANEPRP